MIARNHIRAARYRALALTEKDQARANLLDRLAEEAEHGVLCVRHLRLVHCVETAPPAPSLDAGGEFNSTVAAPMI
jgi:hypothetical protein